MLLARGDVALAMGLPIYGVLGWVGSFSDGIHTSIPAPGQGILAAACGGDRSPLGRALTRWGASADDIALVYKHDTSTAANDPNENALHDQIQAALGRSEGNPLFVVSQKALTGHSKGGAGAWQVAGLCQALHQGVVPGNRNLESVDDAMRPYHRLCFTDETLRADGAVPLRAGLVTSLGFGHVGCVALVLHSDALLAALPDATRQAWRARAAQRLEAAARQRAEVLMGRRPHFERRTDRRLGAAAAHGGDVAIKAAEAAILLDPAARLDPATGVLSPSPSPTPTPRPASALATEVSA
jgi:fatty acid synthase